MALAIQESLQGKYEILAKIGEGGIGSVYKVRHRLLQEIRVIKVLRAQVASKEDLQERFLHEARMAIRLKHPNIAQLHDFAMTPEGTAYIVMEFIDGVALDDLLRVSGAPSIDLALEICQQALSALAYFHGEKFVHRDISPDNLMLATDFDGSPLAKLIDLGIAKNLEGELGLTVTGMFLGKVRYSSPEQFSTSGGGEDLDHRSDLYSFGVMLYELLTGEHPFTGKTFSQVASCHLFEAPRSFDESDPQGRIPGGLRRVILKSLEKEPGKRFSSAEEMAESLAPFRDPEGSLGDELQRTLEVTVASLAQRQASEDPGSTQIRLDRDFGMVTTPSPKTLSLAEAEDPTVLMTAVKKEDTSTSTSRAWKRWVLAAIVILGAAAVAMWFLRDRIGAPLSASAAGAEDRPERVRLEPTERFDSEGSASLVGVEPPPFDAGGQTRADGEPDLPTETHAAAGGEAGAGNVEPGEGEATAVNPDEVSTDSEAAGATLIEIYESGVGVVPPVLLELPRAIHPDGKKLKKEVVLMVSVLVDEHGGVMNPSISSGPTFKKRVREAALEVVRGAKFQPASKGGVAGRMWTEVRIVFSPEEEAPEASPPVDGETG